jgi:cytochrome P450
MIDRDAPDHTRLRKLVQKAFTPKSIQALAPRIGELVDEMLDRVADAAGHPARAARAAVRQAGAAGW